VLSGGFGGVCEAPWVGAPPCMGGAGGRGGGGGAGRGGGGGAAAGLGGGGATWAAGGGAAGFGAAAGAGAGFGAAVVVFLRGFAFAFAVLRFAVRAFPFFARLLARADAPRFFAGRFAFLRPLDFDFAFRAIKPPLLRG
jgi:hypothetical protein